MLFLLACAPSTPTVTLAPEFPTTLDDLTVTIDADDGYRFEWFQERQVLDLGGETVSSAQTARGEEWAVRVTPIHRGREGEPATAAVVIGNAPPAAVVTLAGGHAEQPLAATVESSDPDGDVVQIRWAWTRDGEVTELAGPDVLSTYTADGEVWEVTATPWDGWVEGPPSTALVTIGNAPPVVLSVELRPKPPTSEDVLYAEVEVEDVDGDTVDLLWSWWVDGEAVSEASELDPVPRGSLVKVEVTPYDGQQLGEPMWSDEFAVQNGAPSKPVVAIVSESTHAGWDAECVALDPLLDPDGDPLTEQVSWFIDGAFVTDPSATVEGQLLTCVLQVSDGQGANVDGRDDVTVLWACGLDIVSEVSGAGSSAFDAGDVDADGAVDLVVDDRVFWGPDFTTWSELGFGDHSGRIGIGDLDGDGVPELVGSRAEDGQLDVLWGDGTLEVVTQGDLASDVAIADVDGDGVNDIVMQCLSGAAYRPIQNGVVMGQSSLNARVGAMVAVDDRVAQLVDGVIWVEDVAVAEGYAGLAADGVDLVVWGPEGVDLLEADGIGGFDVCPIHEDGDLVMAVDFDGNGTPDLVKVSDGWTMSFNE